MKPTSEILERIEKCSSEHKDGVFTRLYRYLLREDIYYAAYQKLYANKGATTQGIDNDTADGFSDFYVKELIQSLKDGTYKANPVRREYIPKKNGKLVDVVAGGLVGSAVNGNAVPHLILYHQHTDFLELLAQFLDVIADNAVVDVHIALVVEHIEGAGYIDFKGRSDILGFLFLLFPKQVI